MKNYFILTALLCCFYSAHAQFPLKTINYQAMIVDPAAIELPGGAIQAQLYLNKSVWIRFGIFAGSELQFEELHKTKTDAHGLINLEIGNGESTGKAGAFSDILWGGPVNRLRTEVSFTAGAQYIEVTNQTLNYLPYAFFAQEAAKLNGILPLASGGTGAITAVASRQNLGLGKVDNTADVDKPVSGLVLAELNTKETSGNKSLSILIDSASNTKYPSVKAVKEYVDLVLPKESVTNQASSANLAAKATVLETARTINGVPFDGSDNISIPLDASALTGILPVEKGGTGAETPLLARTNLGLRIGVDVQSPISTGSGLSLTGNTIEVTGLTSANLSATASITNAQLANSQFTLGSSLTTLGGTYTSVIGLESITSTNFIGDLMGNALTANVASSAASATYATTAATAATATTALTANTATTLATPQTIFGYPFDGSTAISGILSSTFGGTGVNNGNKSITLGGDLVISGNFSTTIITTGSTSISLPTSGTLATLAGTETLTNKTLVNSSLTGTLTLGGTTFPSISGVTGQVLSLTSSGVASWTSVLKDGFDETASNGSAGTMTTTTAGQTNFTLTQAPHSTSRLKMYINGILISQNAYAYKTSSSFATDATVPTSYLAYINAKNGTYLIAVGDRVQFVYTY